MIHKFKITNVHNVTGTDFCLTNQNFLFICDVRTGVKQQEMEHFNHQSTIKQKLLVYLSWGSFVKLYPPPPL